MMGRGKLVKKIEDVLEEMQHAVPLSEKWRALEDSFFQLLDQVRSLRLKAHYLRRYAHVGTDDDELAERAYRSLLKSFREDIPEGPRFRNSSYEGIGGILQYANA